MTLRSGGPLRQQGRKLFLEVWSPASWLQFLWSSTTDKECRWLRVSVTRADRLPSTPAQPTSNGMLNRLTRISPPVLGWCVSTGAVLKKKKQKKTARLAHCSSALWSMEDGRGSVGEKGGGVVLKTVSSVFVLCHGYGCVMLMVDNRFLVSLPNRSGLF